MGEFVRTLIRLLVPISISNYMCVPILDLGYAYSALRGVTLPKDVVRWEANGAYSEQLLVQRQRRQDWSATHVAVRAWGEETLAEPKSSRGDDKKEDEDGEGEVTPPPHSLPPEDLPPLGDIISRQAGNS
jgi:hypothetical protein